MIDAITLCPRAGSLIAHDFGKDRAAWLAARRKGLGGSDIAPILGLLKWSSSLKTWRQKMGLDPDTKANWQMKQGTHSEPLIAEDWAERNGVTLVQLPYLTDADKPWRCASVDYLGVFPDGHVEILEIKYSGRGIEDIPDYYYTQVMWYMTITGIHQARLIVADFFHEPEARIVQWSDEIADGLLTAADAWWTRYVEGDEAPEPTMADERKEAAFDKLAETPLAVTADSTACEIVAKLQAAKERKGSAEDEIKTLEADLAEHMVHMGASKLDGGDWAASFVEKQGSIRYAEYVKAQGVSMDELEPYRGTVSRYLTVRTKKNNGGNKE